MHADSFSTRIRVWMPSMILGIGLVREATRRTTTTTGGRRAWGHLFPGRNAALIVVQCRYYVDSGRDRSRSGGRGDDDKVTQQDEDEEEDEDELIDFDGFPKSTTDEKLCHLFSRW